MHLNNTTVHSLAWNHVTVTVQDRQTKQPRMILSDVNGMLRAGNRQETYLRPRSCTFD